MPPNPNNPTPVGFDVESNPSFIAPAPPPSPQPLGTFGSAQVNAAIAELQASQTPTPDDWVVSTSAPLGLSKTGRQLPSKDRCFYLVLTERDINAYMNMGHAFGVEESAVIDGEARVVKQQQSVYIVKCVGRLEFVKPKFEEIESDAEDDGNS